MQLLRVEGNFMKTKLLAVMLLAGGSMFAQTRFSVGVGFGGQGGGFYQAPPSYANDIPPSPGPDYYWVDGYWSQDHGRNAWIAGYWNRQQFSEGYQVEPHFDNRFNDRDDARSFTRGFDQESRNIGGQNRSQARGVTQGQSRDSGRNQTQNQNRGNSNRASQNSSGQGNRQESGSTNGFRGR
jgi:hypothetical protein